MSVNKLALLRYKTIDRCLQNRYRKWTLDDLIRAVSEALFEYEGMTGGISRRTIQYDIQMMRSDKLGYNAPIIVTDKKYYSYEDRNYTITRSPLSLHDVDKLKEVVGMLRQFSGFGYYNEMQDMVARLEDKVFAQQNQGRSYIDFEKNELLKGLSWIDPIHRAIMRKYTLLISYQSFKAREPVSWIFYPYLLKEYRNRWFLLGAEKKGMTVMLLALDRMEDVQELPGEDYREHPSLETASYFDNVIGVSKTLQQKAQTVVLKIRGKDAPYVITKPLHHTQEILKRDDNGWMIFSIRVVWNFELEREILGFGESILVLSPKRLAGKIRGRTKAALENYISGG